MSCWTASNTVACSSTRRVSKCDPEEGPTHLARPSPGGGPTTVLSCAGVDGPLPPRDLPPAHSPRGRVGRTFGPRLRRAAPRAPGQIPASGSIQDHPRGSARVILRLSTSADFDRGDVPWIFRRGWAFPSKGGLHHKAHGCFRRSSCWLMVVPDEHGRLGTAGSGAGDTRRGVVSPGDVGRETHSD